MARQIIRFGFAGTLAMAALLAEASLTNATGYWNVPSNTGQWWGHGFGGGYHARLMLGPVTHEYLYPPNDMRLPHAPNPHACAPCYGGCGNAFPSTGMDGPTMMEPVSSPEALPQPIVAPAAPAARRPLIFAPPVQR